MSKTVASPTISPTVSPPFSPSQSGASSPVQSRRVLQRRGSTTAADPWGAHLELNMNPGRTTSCKLTIVRVDPAPQIRLDEQPPSPQQRRHFGFGSHSQNPHRRHGGHGHTVAGKGENTRMSFASASFAPPGSPTGPGPRPGSPTHGNGHGLNRRPTAPKPRLSADQILSLAQQSCNPQSTPSSPRTPGGSLTATTRSGRTSFTAIPDDVFLPFVDRPDEVNALFTSPQPGARLFALLAQTFAPQFVSDAPATDDAVYTTDPRKWTSAQLEFWMKRVDRDTAPDEVWVGLIRRCVLFHSELIWERIKGALGAPPELDPDGFEEDPFAIDRPLTFDDFKLDSLSDPVASPTEDHPPVPDTVPQPQPASDHASESTVPVPTEDSPSISTLTIEPVLMPSSPSAEHDHPPTRPGGHRMHDISEEGPSENENKGLSGPSPPREIVQGLRISTAPATPGIFAADSPPANLLRTSSMSSVNQLLQQQQPQTPEYHSSPRRSGSMSSLGRRWSNASSEVYNVVGERGPGNPLFPTNFARLALGPTLSANNPALRSQNLPPESAFSNPHSIRASVVRGRRGKPSWAEGWDPSKHEYAVTASEGSVGGH